jgi:hypothetical protein
MMAVTSLTSHWKSAALRRLSERLHGQVSGRIGAVEVAIWLLSTGQKIRRVGKLLKMWSER